MTDYRQHWKTASIYDRIVIFIVFAINGSLSGKISVFFMNLLKINKTDFHWFWYYLLFIVLVFPIYPFLLLVIGYLFGQSKFFFPFAKKIIHRIGLGFVFKNRR